MGNLMALVRRSLSSPVASEFERRSSRQADLLKQRLSDGELSTEEFAIGAELELYYLNRRCLAEVPDELFEYAGVEPEVGLHNAEITTTPHQLSPSGISEMELEMAERVSQARERVPGTLVADGMWVHPPEYGTVEYLSSVTTHDDLTAAENMRQFPRYIAIDNAVLRAADDRTIRIDLPGVDATFPSMLVESLTSSLQPHLQVPDCSSLCTYHNAAIRTLAPVLSLCSNSPFLPADLYSPSDRSVIQRTPHECRVPVFEQSINTGPEKVCVPDDLNSTAEVIDRLLEDASFAPMLSEWEESPDCGVMQPYWEWNYKRGTYWRWVRGVIGSDTCSGLSTRIEYRPLPAQPTVTDNIAISCFVTGLLHGIVTTEHPVLSLPWGLAEESFYSAVRRGDEADFAWITRDGTRTSDRETVYDDVFWTARQGLDDFGFNRAQVDRWLSVIEPRREMGPPSRWKKELVRRWFEAGHTLDEAICRMQTTYVSYASSGTPYCDWADTSD